MDVPKIRKLVQRFIEATNPHEKFALAQAIATEVSPATQVRLDTARKNAMKHIVDGSERIKVERRQQAIMLISEIGSGNWQKHQITPEVSYDQELLGKRVPRQIIKDLNNALRAQHHVIVKAVRRFRNFKD